MNEENKSGQWEVTLLGVRGSVPVTPKEYQEFGGDTLCVRIEAGDQVIFLDAGSGILHGQPGRENHVLIGHPHLDHLLGLCKWKGLSDKSGIVKLYAADHCGLSCRELLQKLFGPPFWPIHLENVHPGLTYVSVKGAFEIEGIFVDVLSGNHPGGVTHYRLSDGQRSLVYAVDCELTPEAEAALREFARDCDLLIIDGQLSEDEREEKKGWGHSVSADAARLGRACGAKQTVLVHFDPSSTDEMLEREEEKIRRVFPDCHFGRQGERLFL